MKIRMKKMAKDINNLKTKVQVHEKAEDKLCKERQMTLLESKREQESYIKKAFKEDISKKVKKLKNLRVEEEEEDEESDTSTKT